MLVPTKKQFSITWHSQVVCIFPQIILTYAPKGATQGAYAPIKPNLYGLFLHNISSSLLFYATYAFYFKLNTISTYACYTSYQR